MLTTTKTEHDGINRRSFLGAAAAILSATALAAPAAIAQSREEVRKGTDNHSADNPGPVNKRLQSENDSSNTPPDTDHGDVSPFWYSFETCSPPHSGRRLDPAGHAKGSPRLQRPRRSEHAPHCRKLPRAALAHRQRVGLHALWLRPHHCTQPRRNHLHRRCQRGRPLVLPCRLPALHPGSRPRRLRVPPRLRPGHLLRVPDLPHLRLGRAHAAFDPPEEPQPLRGSGKKTPRRRGVHLSRHHPRFARRRQARRRRQGRRVEGLLQLYACAP